jgi:hypothetical protein
MKLFMKIVIVSMASSLAACSSMKKKAEPAPIAPAASNAAVQKPTTPVPSAKPEKAEKVAKQIQCENGTDKRTIAVESTSESGCEVHYSKFGNSEKVASAVHTPSFCEEVKDKIRSHLEAGQFSCK